MSDLDLSTSDELKLEAYADRLWESVETHQLSDAAFAALSDLVVDCTVTGTILRANAAFCEFSGLEADQIEGRDSHEFAFLQGRDASRCTIELLSENKEAKWFDRLQLSMRDPQSGNRFIRIVGRDITEHKRSEIALTEARTRAEEADMAKSRFLAMVSHEIRTPLNGIIGMGKLLSDTRLSDEQKNYVEAITTSSEALLVLVNDLLQFGRNELTEQKLSNEPTDVRALAAGVIELLAEKAHIKQLDLGYFVQARVPEKVSVDGGRLRQLLFNVIGNAVKFTAKGGVRTDVDFQDDTLIVRVRDTGPGIGTDDQNKIFEPFEQVENTYTRTHDGAGLGLAISKRMAMAMGGDISLESQSDEGSVFTIRVAAQPVDCDHASTSDLSGKSILALAKPGFETDILCEIILANGGHVEVSDKLLASSSEQFDTIVLDSRLTAFDAHEARDWGSDTRLVAMIAPNERGSVGARFQANGHAFLTRPVRQPTCLRVLCGEAKASGDIISSQSIDGVTPKHKAAQKVLLAEDNAINALLATRLLEKQGYDVTHVENGREAVEAFKGANFDLVLMDYHMPLLDGVDAIKAIRKTEEEHGSVSSPIFMVTADTSQEMRQVAIDAGASENLEKPLCLEALDRALASMNSKVA